MLARALPQRNYIIVPLPPMQCRTRYAEVVFQVCWPRNRTRPVFNALAIAWLISRFYDCAPTCALSLRRARSRLGRSRIETSLCVGREPANKFKGQGSQIVMNGLLMRCRNQIGGSALPYVRCD